MTYGQRARSKGEGERMDGQGEREVMRWYVPVQGLAAGLVRLGERLRLPARGTPTPPVNTCGRL
jgi:hypothetical protein